MFLDYAAQLNALISRQRGPNYRFHLFEGGSDCLILWEQASKELMYQGEPMMAIREYKYDQNKNELSLIRTVIESITQEEFNLGGFVDVKNPICVY